MVQHKVPCSYNHPNGEEKDTYVIALLDLFFFELLKAHGLLLRGGSEEMQAVDFGKMLVLCAEMPFLVGEEGGGAHKSDSAASLQ